VRVKGVDEQFAYVADNANRASVEDAIARRRRSDLRPARLSER
jgi:hypothetical protein